MSDRLLVYSRTKNSLFFLYNGGTKDYSIRESAVVVYQPLLSGRSLHDTGRRGAAARQLVDFHQRFAPLFGKAQVQDHAYHLPQGGDGSPMQEHRADRALRRQRPGLGPPEVHRGPPWAYDDVQAEAQALFSEQFAPSALATPIGVVGVVDESGFAKKGTKSAGVARQYNGRLGKKDNCQVGVYLIGVAPAGVALLEHQLYIPERPV